MDVFESEEYCRELLVKWKKEDDISYEPIIFKGFAKLETGVAGKCAGYKDGKCEIFLSHKLIGNKLHMEVVEWHEYCHGYTWVKYHTMGHDSVYLKKKFSKPILALLDILFAFVFIFKGDKE